MKEGAAKMRKNKHFFSCFVSVLLIISIVTNGCSHDDTNANVTVKKNDTAQMQKAQKTPFGKYPKEISYTLGKMTGANNSNMPENDNYENNAYTRYLKEKLNIQNKDVFEVPDEEYDSFVSMAMATGNLPDVMLVRSHEELEELVKKDLIADLSEVYENCASKTIKEIYQSYDKSLLSGVRFEGKLMALPETNIDDGPNLFWVRKDWMDKLGLQEPRTMQDVEEIVTAFVKKNPGENGPGETVGLLCDTKLTGECGYSSQYLMDIVFSCYGAYPKQWIENKDKEVVYGSIQPEVKKALSKLHEYYKTGVLDKGFLLRTSNNLKELIINGKAGAFFGPWWSPNNPLVDAVRKNSRADWKPYLITTDGTVTNYFSQNPTYKYVVVRKGFKHPEIVVKILNVLFDYARYQDKSANEIAKYYQWNVDPTARPLAINVDYNDALQRCYHNLRMVMNGVKAESNLEVLERSYYNSCQSYKNNPKEASAEDWAAYASRIEACSVIGEGKIKKIPSLYFGKTKTMQKNWWKLQELEEKTFLEIVSGAKPISYFDRFVAKWKKQKGDLITNEVQQELKEEKITQ